VSTTPLPSTSELAVEILERDHAGDRSAADRFLSAHRFPLVEGSYCTFIYRGEADAVFLRHWIYGLPSSQPFHRLPGTDLWSLVLELPEQSRIEYKIEVHREGHAEWIQDPLNPLLAHDPFGANSVCHATGYQTPEWTQPDASARQGWLDERMLHSEALGGPRRVTLYFPARYRRSRHYPLLVVHDGVDYLRYASLKVVLDNLIHRLEIPELIVALTEPRDRLEEYAASERHARFLLEELVPLLERELPLQAAPEGRGLVGASLGAVAALHTAARQPGFFGRLLLQSGSFAFSDIGEPRGGPVVSAVAGFVNRFRRSPAAVSRKVFVSCGIYESLIYENRSLVPVLQRTPMEVRYVEARDGHNWENWRDRLREGLSWLFPGPLWMVYE